MKTKEEIMQTGFSRYTKKESLEDFGEYILLTNFNKYVELFVEVFRVLERDAISDICQCGG